MFFVFRGREETEEQSLSFTEREGGGGGAPGTEGRSFLFSDAGGGGGGGDSGRCFHRERGGGKSTKRHGRCFSHGLKDTMFFVFRKKEETQWHGLCFCFYTERKLKTRSFLCF